MWNTSFSILDLDSDFIFVNGIEKEEKLRKTNTIHSVLLEKREKEAEQTMTKGFFFPN